MLDFLKFWQANKPCHPALIKNHVFFTDFDQSQPIEKYDFVVIDTELTGMHKRRDEVVSIGAIKIKNLQIQAGETFYSLVRPPHHKRDATDSTFIHRIRPQELDDAPDIKTILPELMEFCGSALFVGHHIGLDTSFLNKAAKKHYNCAIHSPCLDTIRLAQIFSESSWRRRHDDARCHMSYNLTDLSQRLNLPLFAAHNALQDSLQTAYLFIYLVKQLQSTGLVTLRDFYAAGQSWARVF
jgi:DNA polymerase-3 subunit epsilon